MGYHRKDKVDLCDKCKKSSNKSRFYRAKISSIKCPICNTEFNTTVYNKKYCSKKCKAKQTRDKRRFTEQGKLKHRVSSLISTRLRLQNLSKNNKSTFDILPYTLLELQVHLEAQFEDWMSWDNYGLKGWTIDHIIPESSFNYSSTEDEEFKRCWALSNLRPIRHSGKGGNASKGNR